MTQAEHGIGPAWDDFYLRTFNRDEYNCLHFTSDVWEMLTGVSIRDQLTAFLADHTQVNRRAEAVRTFTPVLPPHSLAHAPLIAVMQRPRSVPHVGVLVRGKVFHLHELGVEYQPPKVAMRGFTTIRYFQCNTSR